MTNPRSADRELASRLSGILYRFLDGRLEKPQVVLELRKLADWLERGAPLPQQGKEDSAAAAREIAAVTEVFRFWVEATQRNSSATKLTDQRRTKIVARLREGYSVDDLKRAIRAVAQSEFHQGKNERGSRYDDIELICRNGTNVEKYREMSQGGATFVEDDEISVLQQEASEALAAGDMDAYGAINEKIRRARRGD